MSFNKIHKVKYEKKPFVAATSHSKIVFVDKEVNGIICQTMEFGKTDFASDPRDSVSYKDLCLGNLRAIGALSSLKECMMQRNDVDLVIDSLNALNDGKQVETPAEDKKA